jgi:hypothetical protein
LEKTPSQTMSIFEKIFGKKKESGQISQSKPRFYAPDFDKYNEFGQIISIFDYVLNPDFAIADKAAKTIHRLFNNVSVFKNKQLYETFRCLRINKSDIQRFDRFDLELKVTLLCIASMNGNGYSREIALDKLAEIKTKKTIPFILFRLADWVSPIRIKAEAIFKSFITEENTLYFIQNHKLLNWLLQVERTDLTGLFNEISDLLTLKPLENEELNMLSEGERFFYFISFARQEKLDNKMVSQMLNDKYYLIRIIVIKNLDKLNDQKNVLSKLLSDKSQKVRQGAISLIYNQKIEDFEEILRELIFDTSSTVRYDSRKLLDKIGKQNYITYYKTNLKNHKHLATSILGLSEVSDKSDIETIKPFLNSEKARVKSAALFGIYNLDNDFATNIAYQIIQDINPVSTKKVAEMILSKQGIDYNKLRQIYDKTDTAGKKVILRLFNQFSGWSVAGDFLKALTENDDSLKLMAKSFLRNWNLYTIGLATNQKPEDKDYVMTWYNKTKEMGLKVPGDIPFIFGEK